MASCSLRLLDGVTVLHNARGWRTRPSEALPVPMKGISVSVAGMGDCKLG